MKEEYLTNIADILRDATVGIKLYSTAFGEVEFSGVVDNEIGIYCEKEGISDCYVLDQYGRYVSDGDCILFPKQWRLCWNGWQAWLFRDELSLGKVVVDTLGGCFIIINNSDDIKVADSKGNEFVLDSKELDKFRFATQTERKEFFEFLRRNHCNWDNETKTIFKISPEKDCTRIMNKQEEPKELYTDEEAKEFANKVSHEWWQIAMDKWKALPEEKQKEYNQYIGFNDFSDHLMNILRSVLLGLKRNGKLVYEEGSLFSEPNQKPTEIELDETPIPCDKPTYFSCNGNCGYCVYHTTTGCNRKIEYDKTGCESGVSSGKYNSACESDVSSGEYDFCLCNKDNKYIPKLKVGDKACLSDKNDNIYFEEILKVNDEEYYTKTFGWINCKAIDELHEINFKEYNKPFRISDFKPFDKVLWRLGHADVWSIGFFDNYYISGEDDKVSYSVVGYEKDWVPQCVPYNIDTAYLHDTDKEYDGKYKTW